MPSLLPDYRDTVDVLVHKDLRIYFDGNRYCAPPHLVGEHLLLKADAHNVALYHQQRQVVFTKRLRLTPGRAYCVAGKVNSVNTLYLVVESVKLDTKHGPPSTTPIRADGAGG